MEYNINILSTNAFLHLNRNFTVIEAAHSAIGHFCAKASGNTISKCLVTVSGDNLQLVATRNKLVLKSARVETGITTILYIIL